MAQLTAARRSGFPFNPAYFEPELTPPLKRSSATKSKRKRSRNGANQNVPAQPAASTNNNCEHETISIPHSVVTNELDAQITSTTNGLPRNNYQSNTGSNNGNWGAPISEKLQNANSVYSYYGPSDTAEFVTATISTSLITVINSPVNDRLGLLLIPTSQLSVVYMAGILNVSLLRGVANINGYSIPANTPVKVHSSTWQPANRLHLHAPRHKPDNDSLSWLISRNNLTAEFPPAFIASLDSTRQTLAADAAVLLIRGYSWEELTWLEAAEDYSKFDRSYLSGVDVDIWSCSSAIVATAAQLNALNIESLWLPQSWVQGVDRVFDALQSHPGQQSVEFENKKTPKVLFCGAKGVGKSTCLRYTINRLLGKCKAVCVMDCDVGQPEFGLPGTLSLVIVQSPVLVPNYSSAATFAHNAELQFHLGDITCKSDPESVINAVIALTKRYEELKNEVAKFGCLKRTKVATHSKVKVPTNIFALLDPDDDDEKEVDEPPVGVLPLLVNCDGYIRMTGADILTSIVTITEPTHVFQIVTAKDRELPSLAGLDRNTQQIIALEPGRSTPSKILAPDLRQLRLLSYFLEEKNEFLKMYVNPLAQLPQLMSGRPLEDTEVPAAPANFINDDVAEGDEATLSEDIINDVKLGEGLNGEAEPLPSLDTMISLASRESIHSNQASYVRISNGALVDTAGMVAFAFLSIQPYRVPLGAVAFRMLDHPVVPRLVLAAFNATLIAIARHVPPPRKSSAANKSEDSDEVDCTPPIEQSCSRIVQIQEPLEGTTFDLDCEGSIEYLETIGLAVVRGVDPCAALIYISTPCDLSAVKPDEKLYLLRGGMQLPVSFYYSPAMPLNPYLTGELIGDGSNAMKSRTNIKRRSQHPR